MLKSDKPSGTGSADFVKTQTFLRPLKYRDIGLSHPGGIILIRNCQRTVLMAHSYSPVTAGSSFMAYSA